MRRAFGRANHDLRMKGFTTTNSTSTGRAFLTGACTSTAPAVGAVEVPAKDQEFYALKQHSSGKISQQLYFSTYY